MLPVAVAGIPNRGPAHRSSACCFRIALLVPLIQEAPLDFDLLVIMPNDITVNEVSP